MTAAGLGRGGGNGTGRATLPPDPAPVAAPPHTPHREETLPPPPPPPRPQGRDPTTTPGAVSALCYRLFTLSRVEADSPRLGEEQGEGAQQTRQPPRHPHGSLRGGRARSAPRGRCLSSRRPPGPAPHPAAPPCFSPAPRTHPPQSLLAVPPPPRLPSRPRSLLLTAPHARAPPAPSPPPGWARAALLPPPPPPPSAPRPPPPAGRRGEGCPAAFRRWPSPDPHFFKADPRGGRGSPARPRGRSCPMAEGGRPASPLRRRPARAGPSAPAGAGRDGPGRVWVPHVLWHERPREVSAKTNPGLLRRLAGPGSP